MKDATPIFGKPYEDVVLSCGWSPDGSMVVGGDLGGWVKIWDVASNKADTQSNQEKYSLHLDGAAVDLAWSPDSASLAYMTSDGSIGVWSIQNNNNLVLGKGDSEADQSWEVAWSPENGILASSGPDKTIRFWDPNTPGELNALNGHAAPIQGLVWSPDGRWLASVGGAQYEVSIWGLPLP